MEAMLKINKLCSILASICAAQLLVACDSSNSAKDSNQASKSPVAVTVNGAPITQSQVEGYIHASVASRMPGAAVSRAAVVDELAMQKVLSQAAERQGLGKTPEFAQRVELIRQAALANAYVAHLRDKNPVTDAMLTAEYERIKADASNALEYKARHILVADEAQAKSIIAKLKVTPSAFAALAAQYSLDTTSKPNGGDLGWGNPRGMGPEFSAGLTGLEKGRFTEAPVKTQYGYHVILFEDTRVGEILPLSALRADLSQKLAKENLEKQLDALKAAAKIELSTEKAATQPKAKS